MSEPTAKAGIRYEQPAIVRRDAIEGILFNPIPQSDGGRDGGTGGQN